MSEREFPPELCDILCDWQGCRADIHREFDKDLTFEQRGILLGIFNSVMNVVEKNVISPYDLEKFKILRDQDYCFLLVKESRQGDDANSELLERATRREVDAGRMSPDHKLRQLAIAAVQRGIATSESLDQLEKTKPQGSWWKRLVGR